MKRNLGSLRLHMLAGEVECKALLPCREDLHSEIVLILRAMREKIEAAIIPRQFQRKQLTQALIGQ
jgi:hypothetical protein